MHEPLFSGESTVMWDRAMARKPRLAFDVGAHGGLVATKLARHCGSVHAFEPVPDNFQKLRGVTDSFHNIQPFNLGVSDNPGRIENASVFNVWTLLSPADAAAQRADKAIEFTHAPTFDVVLTTVDRHAAVHGMPDFMKVDVDGYDAKVLYGAYEVLYTARPPVFFEFSYLPQRFLGDDAVGMCGFIYNLGYRAWSTDGKFVCETAGEMMDFYPRHTSYDVMLVHRENEI